MRLGNLQVIIDLLAETTCQPGLGPVDAVVPVARAGGRGGILFKDGGIDAGLASRQNLICMSCVSQGKMEGVLCTLLRI